MTLNLNKSYVTAQMQPVARIEFAGERNLADLPARPTMKDYADIHQPFGVLAHYFFSGADSTLTGNSNDQEQVTNGMNISTISDGMFDLLPGDSANERWSLSGEGRLRLDLQKEIEIDSLHIFTVQQLGRGAQSFSIWGASGEKSPDVKGDPKAAGWKFMTLAQPEDTWGNNKAVYRIFPEKGLKIECRYILFVSEDSPHGPYYFRELDVFEKQN